MEYQNFVKDITRRQFLGLAGALSCGALLSSYNPRQQMSHEELINNKIENMGLKERIAQMVITIVPRPREKERFFEYYKPGNIVYMGWRSDIKNKSESEIQYLSEELQNLSMRTTGFPLLIFSDIEGGKINRLAHIREFKSAEQYGKEYTSTSDKDSYLEEVIKDAEKQGRFLRSLGINANLVPCLDIAISELLGKPKNDVEDYFVHWSRVYSDNAEVVSILGNAWINGLKAAEVMPVAKHYPGIGKARDLNNPNKIAQPEYNMSSITDDKMLAEGLSPFKYVIEKGLPGIMIGHAYTPLDADNPASMSNKSIDFLRENLKFDGLVIADDLIMLERSRYDGNEKEWAIKMINAGCDLIMDVNYRKIPMIIDSIEKAVFNGKINENRINSAVKKILKAKINFNKSSKIA